jgi:hypothetical protein
MRLAAALSAAVAFAILGTAPAFADDDRWIEAYRTMSLQEPAPQEPKPEAKPAVPAAQEGAPGEPFAESWEVAAHFGFCAFSSEFEADPEFSAGLSVRAAMPWFSKTVLGLDEASIGLFLDFTFSSIDRDIPVLKEPDGTLIFFTVGLDFTVYKDETWVIRPQLGLQYGHFGGVTDLDNGIAVLLGVELGVSFAEGWRVFFDPQVGIGEDMVFFLPLGVAYSF